MHECECACLARIVIAAHRCPVRIVSLNVSRLSLSFCCREAEAAERQNEANRVLFVSNMWRCVISTSILLLLTKATGLTSEMCAPMHYDAPALCSHWLCPPAIHVDLTTTCTYLASIVAVIVAVMFPKAASVIAVCTHSCTALCAGELVFVQHTRRKHHSTCTNLCNTALRQHV